MTHRYPSRLVSRSLVGPRDLHPGAVFLVPALAAPPAAAWWHVDRLVDLAADGVQGDRVRVILQETDYRGRPYRVDLDAADCVVWACTLAPAVLAVARLGHRVACPSCRASWGYLPVTVSDAPCYRCHTTGPVGI